MSAPFSSPDINWLYPVSIERRSFLLNLCTGRNRKPGMGCIHMNLTDTYPDGIAQPWIRCSNIEIENGIEGDMLTRSRCRKGDSPTSLIITKLQAKLIANSKRYWPHRTSNTGDLFYWSCKSFLRPLCCWWLIWSKKNYAKNLKND